MNLHMNIILLRTKQNSLSSQKFVHFSGLHLKNVKLNWIMLQSKHENSENEDGNVMKLMF